MTDPVREELYPCVECGKLRTKAEGGTTFTVCDECWKKTMGETMTESNLVREEMKEILHKFHCKGMSYEYEDYCTDLLRVIRGHTEHRKLLVGFVERGGEQKRVVQKRRVCDTALTHTLESLPEEK